MCVYGYPMSDRDDTFNDPVGLRAVRLVFASSESKPGIGRTLSIAGVEATEGHVVLTGSPTEDHYNPLGTVHGGYIATILDGTMALAAHTTLHEEGGCATIDLKISYIRPLTDVSGPLRCVGSVINKGRRLILGEASLLDVQGRLCARATATLMIAEP